MRKLIALLILALAAGAFAQDVTVSTADASPQNLWLVEFNSAPTADGGTSSATQKDKTNFRSAAKAAKINFTERKSFDTLWNGMPIAATPGAAAAIQGLPGVKAVYPDAQVTYNPGADDSSAVEMVTAVTMTGADQARSTLGLTGAGVKVAVIDTGLDYRHPDLGNCSGGIGPGCRVAKGYDLVGDAFNNSTITTPTPDNDPMDCAGHGTHVAGIIGANGDPTTGGVRGVAPGVIFYSYRVFGCTGTTQSSIMLDALERLESLDRRFQIRSRVAADRIGNVASARG